MNIRLILIFSFLFFLTGCEKFADKPYNELIEGTWINTLVDGKAVETNEVFVMKFTAKGEEIYSAGYQIDENNWKWLDGSKFNYTVENNHLNISGTNIHNDQYDMLFVLEFSGDTKLVYSVPSFKINGEEIGDNKVYTCQKIDKDFKDNLLGLWYGNTVEPGNNDTTSHYWEFFADGHYDYYYHDNEGHWIKKEDNAGQWFLYGNFIALNSFNEFATGSLSKSYKCWNITFDENRMTWEANRQNGQYGAYWFKKATAVP